MENVLYWIWLTSKPLISPQKITSLLEHFNTIEGIYQAKTYYNIPNIGEKEADALRNKSLQQAKRIKAETDAMGANIITFDDTRYPKGLRNIIPPPYILYVMGDIESLNNVLAIAVVGTRRYSDYGKIVTMRFAGSLAKSGVTIVTGLAVGADGAAARAALREGGRVVGVLGSGLDVMYPPENTDLIKTVAQKGVLISEYPPSTEAYKWHFPERNRIIAGLASGVLVTEAPKRSGSLITARIAMEAGRDVFAIPANVTENNSMGCNRIIQQGAKPVMSAEDILVEYPYAVRQTVKPKTQNKPKKEDKPDKNDISSKFADLKDDDKRIVSVLMREDRHIDELSRELGINAGELNVKLTLLEMKGAIKKLAGGIYKINV